MVLVGGASHRKKRTENRFLTLLRTGPTNWGANHLELVWAIFSVLNGLKGYRSTVYSCEKNDRRKAAGFVLYFCVFLCVFGVFSRVSVCVCFCLCLIYPSERANVGGSSRLFAYNMNAA